MERKIIITKDGSHTLLVPEMNVTYHSIYGAIRESQHVFIEAGFKTVRPLEAARRIRILEIGFGSGLNVLLTLIEAEKLQMKIHYTTVELFPLSPEEAGVLNYCQQLNREELQTLFHQLHQCEWEKEIPLTPFFTFYKTNETLINISVAQAFNLVYFDAFAPAAQPELWTKEMFENLYSMMSAGGILVTYSSKGGVRRAMRAVGSALQKFRALREKEKC